ncbi:MAG TPA: T9SS type A sorting domain-containing protein, partial [Chitinophagaceae bacterium]|nr:T9SS type A sorting domain-containing protein [Chitinophagaceae bacterium]
LSTIVLVKGERPVITVIDGVFPNPARSSVNILIAASEREKVTLVVTDMAGRVVSSKIVSVEQGSNTIPLDINQLNKGSFIVKLVCENGCNSAAKFMKL